MILLSLGMKFLSSMVSFWPKINIFNGKPVNTMNGSSLKIGHAFWKLSVSKLQVIKKRFSKLLFLTLKNHKDSGDS